MWSHGCPNHGTSEDETLDAGRIYKGYCIETYITPNGRCYHTVQYQADTLAGIKDIITRLESW